MTYYDRALAINEEIIKARRYLHAHAEVGVDLPESMAYITSVLESFGLRSERCGCGVVCTVGDGEKSVLLRADADALPITEESGESFTSIYENAAHCCGHDVHSAMLLGAAKILSERRDKLCGKVVFMFQAGEELLLGCRDMISSGLFTRFSPSAAFAVHTAAGKIEPGAYMYNAGGVMMRSADVFEIDVFGKGGHASFGSASDPIRAGCRIYDYAVAVPSLCGVAEKAAVTVGHFSSGCAGNVIPNHASLGGSIRCADNVLRESLRDALKSGIEDIAQKGECRAKINFTAAVPTLICDEKLTQFARKCIENCGVPWRGSKDDISVPASDDFALLAERMPSVYVYLSAGFADSRGDHTAHDAAMQINEDVCAMGSAVYAAFAEGYLMCEQK